MESLPSEISHNIFIRVPFRQRLKCMLVCHPWYNSLCKHSLLYDLDIFSDKRFNNFIDMLQSMPLRGAQVEILVVTATHNIFDKRKLCNMLPNLREFRYNDLEFYRPHQTHFIQSFEPLYSHSKLESIIDEADCELTRQLLMSASCHRLRKLSLKLDRINNPREELFIYFKNTPALKELSLRNCSIGIEVCEMIHKSAPTLEIFHLDELSIIPGKIPQDIAPATSVTSFRMRIQKLKHYSDHLDWYKYMAMKYISLKSFIWDDYIIISRNTYQIMRIYQEGILPLYKNNGHRINHFSAGNIPTELNPFNTLDEFGLHIPNIYLIHNEDRPIFEQLAKSNQSKHVKSLNLHYSVIDSPLMLRNFTSLTKIVIDQSSYFFLWDVNLTDYLNGFPPTLTSFSAQFRDVEINELPSHAKNVKSFSLDCSILHPKLAEAISKFFPKLKKLNLNGIVEKNLCINLPNHHLERLTIEAYHYKWEEYIGISFTEINKSQTKYYMEDPDDEDSIQSVSADELDNCVNINVKCAEVRYRNFDIISVDR